MSARVRPAPAAASPIVGTQTMGTPMAGRSHSIAAAAWIVIGDFIQELRRLNRLGRNSDEFANGSRHTQARIIRQRLKAGYRGHTPCC